MADSLPGTRRLAPRLRIGERQDLVRSAAGRALLLDLTEQELASLWRERGPGGARADGTEFLAAMRRAAQTGIVVDAGETEHEIGSMAAPVRGADGRIRAALGIAMAASYGETGLGPAAQDALRRAARTVSQELGWRITNRHDARPPAGAECELQGKPEGIAQGSNQAVPREGAGTDERTTSDGSRRVSESLAGQLQTVRAAATPASAILEGPAEPMVDEEDDQGMKGRDA